MITSSVRSRSIPFCCFDLGFHFFCWLVDASTFPAELQRLLNTVRELDERSQCKSFLFLNLVSFVCVRVVLFFLASCLKALINQTRQQTKYCLGIASQKGNGNHYNNGCNDEDETIEKMRKEIESSQENALSLCTEKVLLARQAYDLVSSLFLLEFSLLVGSIIIITRTLS